MDHLIFGCSNSMLLWKMVYKWTGFEVVLPTVGRSHYLYHRGMVRGRGLKKLWMVIWFATTWSIWISRNDAIFNVVPFDAIQTLDLIKFRAWCWFQFRGKGSPYNFNDWCTSPLICMLSAS